MSDSPSSSPDSLKDPTHAGTKPPSNPKTTTTPSSNKKSSSNKKDDAVVNGKVSNGGATSGTTAAEKKSKKNSKASNASTPSGSPVPTAAGERRNSGGARSNAVKKDSTKSEGLANLENLISELSTTPSTHPTTNAPSSPPTTTRDRRRKSSSSAAGAVTIPKIVAPPPAPLTSLPLLPTPSASLNPNAGGFKPNQLGVISDIANEGLVTPTASHFDLMTGRVHSPGRPIVGAGGGVLPTHNSRGSQQFSFPQSPSIIQQHQSMLQQQQQQMQLMQQQQYQLAQAQAQLQYLTQDPASIAIAQMQAMQQQQQQQQQIQQQQLLQQQLLQQQQQQQLQLQQQQQLRDQRRYSLTANPNLRESPGDLMAEQQAIQQQLEALRLQQDSLLTRFTEMQQQQAQNLQTSPRSNHQSQPSLSHRRIQSGSMGSFSSAPTNNAAFGGQHGRNQSITSTHGEGGFLGGGGPGEIEFSPSDRSYPRGFGHGRRESAQGSISSLNGYSMGNQSQQQQNAQTQLAEASLHLQQLAAYRSSSGHSRVPSFGMSNTGAQLAMAGYGGGITPSNNNAGGQQRKSLFAPYLPQNSIAPLIKAGKLVVGTLRVNKKNRSDAYITVDGLDTDVYVCGSKDRNRALEGDVVAIELLDVDEVWGTKKGKEEKKRKKEESLPIVSTMPAAASRHGQTPSLSLKKEDLDLDTGLMLLEPDEEVVTDETKPQYAGHVVAVVERSAGQLFSGLLGVLRPSSAATMAKQENERNVNGHNRRDDRASTMVPKIIWFRPTDKRVPLIAIPTDQAPIDFVTSPHLYANRLFSACIKRWPITSLHPFGTLVEELGDVGEIESETKAILKDCGFSTDEFNESVIKCLPTVPWALSDHDLSPNVRRDFRDNRVFTIDPETARDLDDALHIVDNEDGTFEVGVHIADVTHFVKPNSALDREARKRATTVYLVQRAIPMLPRLLSEELCSLTAGVDKLCFSVVFKMSKDGKITETWFGKSIINSAVKLAYSDAQEVIEGRPLPEIKIVAKDGRAGVENDILMMANLARQIRARRFETGALRIDNVKVSFGLDSDGLPNDAMTFVRKEANELIEEFMLSANIAVAGKIAPAFPEQALLRNHAPPIDRRLTAFIERMGRLDIDLDGGSAGSLMTSIEKVTDINSRTTLQHLATKSMQRAKYFCTGSLDISKFQHYALNVPLYTHFTSPIRRYADIIVHRQLEAILAGGTAEMRAIHDTESVTKIASNCNIKKDAAKLAQEQSSHLFLCVLIDDLTKRYGPVIRSSTVIGVLDSAFDIIIPEFGIEKRVHTDQMPLDSHDYDASTNTLTLNWQKSVDVLSWLASNNTGDSHLASVIAAGDPTRKVEVASSVMRDGSIKISPQHLKSSTKSDLIFEDLGKDGRATSQKIQELMSVPVVITADLSKSPPVIKVMAINPFA